MIKRLVNLTPHALTIAKADQSFAVYPPSGSVARVASSKDGAGVVNELVLWKTYFGEVAGLPEPEEGTMYIVSRIVKTAVPERADVVCTGEPIRDKDGVIVACNGLSY